MPLNEPQQREVAQLMLVARAYLALAEPGDTDGPISLGQTAASFTPGARLSPATWARALKAAHMASAAIRLASIDDVLVKANEGRPLYRECRQYFGKGWAKVPDDSRGRSCTEWFHVMLRDAIAHREPEGGAPGGLAARYAARQQCIEATTLGAAHRRVGQTADELEAMLTAKGIVLLKVAT